MRAPSDHTVAVLRAAVADPDVVARYQAKIVHLDGQGCATWTGAVSGRGHGRFWLGSGVAIIAHRFGFALAHGVDELLAAEVLAHGCDEPLCQRVGSGHLMVSTGRRNRRDWAARRFQIGVSPIADVRSARDRAIALRAIARTDPDGLAEAFRPPFVQPPLFGWDDPPATGGFTDG